MSRKKGSRAVTIRKVQNQNNFRSKGSKIKTMLFRLLTETKLFIETF